MEAWERPKQQTIVDGYVTELADDTIDTGYMQVKKPFKLRVVLRRYGIKSRVFVYLTEED